MAGTPNYQLAPSFKPRMDATKRERAAFDYSYTAKLRVYGSDAKLPIGAKF
jgi:hypothetical protein